MPAPLFNWLFARQKHGTRWHRRLEATDLERQRSPATRPQLLDDLKWLQLKELWMKART